MKVYASTHYGVGQESSHALTKSGGACRSTWPCVGAGPLNFDPGSSPCIRPVARYYQADCTGTVIVAIVGQSLPPVFWNGTRITVREESSIPAAQIVTRRKSDGVLTTVQMVWGPLCVNYGTGVETHFTEFETLRAGFNPTTHDLVALDMDAEEPALWPHPGRLWSLEISDFDFCDWKGGISLSCSAPVCRTTVTIQGLTGAGANPIALWQNFKSLSGGICTANGTINPTGSRSFSVTGSWTDGNITGWNILEFDKTVSISQITARGSAADWEIRIWKSRCSNTWNCTATVDLEVFDPGRSLLTGTGSVVDFEWLDLGIIACSGWALYARVAVSETNPASVLSCDGYNNSMSMTSPGVSIRYTNNPTV